MSPSSLSRTLGYAAAGWALLFAAVSVYWALGGRADVESLGLAFSDPALLADPAFRAFVWFTALGKALLAGLALALVQRWGDRFPLRYRRLAAGGVGLLLALYGAGLLVQHGLMALGALPVAHSIGSLDALYGHLLVWDPVWLVGGLLFLAAAVLRGRAR